MEIQNNNFRLRLKEGSVKEFEKIVLSSGLCELFMPMGFVSCEDGELVSYNCSGYTALRQCSLKDIRQALEILEKTFLLVSKAGEYLITPSRIMLTLDTIFYHRKTKQVRIAYVPMPQNRMNLQENMVTFIGEVGQQLPGNKQEYLEKVKKQIKENNYYIKDIIHLISELKRKIAESTLKTEKF